MWIPWQVEVEKKKKSFVLKSQWYLQAMDWFLLKSFGYLGMVINQAGF